MSDNSLTADEISLYDRQIRLWGMAAQTSLRNSNILVINMSGVGVEIIKNLTLGGIGKLTIIDNNKLKEQDLNCNFFVEKDQIGEFKVNASKLKIQDMNPRVKIEIDNRNWEDLEIEEFKKFQIIISTGLNSRQISKIDGISRELNIPMITCCVHGINGFIFNDLIKNLSWIKVEFNENREIGEFNLVSNIVKIDEIMENDNKFHKLLIENKFRKWDELNGKFLNLQFPSDKKKKKKINILLIMILSLLDMNEEFYGKDIEDVVIDLEEFKLHISENLNKFELPQSLIEFENEKFDEYLKIFIRNAYCEYQPSNSIIGGVVAQDVINTIVQKELAINNVSILDGFNSEMPIYIL